MPASILESMPPEIRLAILEKLPDLATLHSLIGASPTYRNTFSAHPDSSLTKIALRELTTRAVHRDFPQPPTLWEVVLLGHQVHPELQSTITSIVAHARDPSSLRLGPDQRAALRQMVALSASAREELWFPFVGIQQFYASADMWDDTVRILLAGDNVTDAGLEKRYKETWRVDWSAAWNGLLRL